MASLNHYIDQRLSRGYAYLTKQDALEGLQISSASFLAAAERLMKKGRLVTPKRGFYLILRPEDRVMGAPDPARWIDPLMKHLGVDYRISLLRAAAFHGSSHQAAMVFQVVAPRQIPAIAIGRQKLQFIYRAPGAFQRSNQPRWLESLKTDAGYAKVAGVELTLLDCVRYFHNTAGINGTAQIVHDLGSKAKPRELADAATTYDSAAVRRLGYLLDRFDHVRQADALLAYAAKAKTLRPLDPSVRKIAAFEGSPSGHDSKWRLIINEPVEIDS